MQQLSIRLFSLRLILLKVTGELESIPADVGRKADTRRGLVFCPSQGTDKDRQAFRQLTLPHGSHASEPYRGQ